MNPYDNKVVLFHFAATKTNLQCSREQENKFGRKLLVPKHSFMTNTVSNLKENLVS